MSRSSNPLPEYTHPLLRGPIDEWRRRAGVDSATPGAPVVEDRSRAERLLLWWRTARARRARGLGRAEARFRNLLPARARD